MSVERIADEAMSALQRGNTDRGEALLREALARARSEARRDVEIRTACVLAELLINTGESDQGLELMDHTLELIGSDPRFGAQARVARRYVSELRPADDPTFVEWGD